MRNQLKLNFLIAVLFSLSIGQSHVKGQCRGSLLFSDEFNGTFCLSILKVLQDGFGNQKYAPCPLLVNMVIAGRLGIKSGEGFYTYTAGNKELVVSERFKK